MPVSTQLGTLSDVLRNDEHTSELMEEVSIQKFYDMTDKQYKYIYHLLFSKRYITLKKVLNNFK